jgi:protein gp37
MSDLFHENVPIPFIQRVWEVMACAHWHTFQILTKRPNRMRKVLRRSDFELLRNAWLGVSVESAAYVARLEALRQTPASVRFISFEPLVGPIGAVDLTDIHWAIVGGESGPRARLMEPAWVDQIHHACQQQGVAFFFKQWGGIRKKKTGRLLNGKTWDEYPLSPPNSGSKAATLRAA